MKIKNKLDICITFSIAFLITFLVFLYENSVGFGPEFTALRALCDGSFVSSVCLIFTGLMIFISNRGGFLIFSYALKKIRRNKDIQKETYYDYVKEKEQKEKASCLHFFIIGFFFLVLSLLCLLWI